MQLHPSLILPLVLATARAAPWPAGAGTDIPLDAPRVNDGMSEVSTVPEWALQSAGIAKRDGLVTCQPKTDEGTDGLEEKGTKLWVPVDQWLGQANEYCNKAYGQANQIPKSQASPASDYLVTLTNQNNRNLPGDPGHITFFFINKDAAATSGISFEDCISGLSHIAGWKGSRWGQSKCWGSGHNDTKGGTWDLGNGFYVGGAVGKGAPASTV